MEFSSKNQKMSVIVNVLVTVLVVFVVTLVSGKDRLTVERGGYEGVFIALHPDLDQSLCVNLKENIEKTITEASNVLKHATGDILHFKTVNVVVPRNWTQCRIITQGKLPARFESADVRIVNERHPLYGDDPWTFQYGPCETPGKFIQFTGRYFRDSSVDLHEIRGKLFAREWLKYRYGVFDELGYPNDRLYPAFYGEPVGSLYPLGKPTGCSDVDIHGDSVTSKDGSRSIFLPDMDSNASESLLYLDFLPQVKKLCTHNDGIAPTKQNVLCEYRNAFDIIMDHEDTAMPVHPWPSPAVPNIRWVEEAPRHLIFLLQSSNIPKEVHTVMRTALYNILDLLKRYRVELTTSVILLVPDGVLNEFPPPPLMEVDQIVLDKSYIWDTTAEVGGVCFQCSVDKARELLDDDDLLKFSELLILTDKSESDSGGKRIRNDLGLKYHFIHIGDPDPGKEFENLTHETEGTYQNVLFSGVPAEDIVQLVHALENVFPSLLPWKVSERTFQLNKTGWGSQDVIFTVPKDLNASNVLVRTYLGVHHGLNLYFKSPESTGSFKEYHEDDWELGHVITTTLTEKWEGDWTMRIRGYNEDEQAAVLEILLPLEEMMQPQRLAKDKLEFHVWTSWDHLSASILNNAEKLYPDNPLIIYASLKYGKSPVVASCGDPERKMIELIVEYQDPSRSEMFYPLKSLMMSDDGRGGDEIVIQHLTNSDIQHGDGIFTAYFVDFVREQRRIAYRFKVRINASQESIYVIEDNRTSSLRGLMHPDPNSPVPYCCGSTIGDAVCKEVKGFTSEITGKVLSVHFLTGLRWDLFPPGRVTDFQVSLDLSRDALVFTWSASGDNYTYGTVETYNLYMSAGNRTTELMVEPAGLPAFKAYGDLQTHAFTFSELNITESGSYTFQIRAWDGTQFSKFSNRANIKIYREKGRSGEIKFGSQDKLAIILFAVLIPLALLALGVFLYFFCRKRRAGDKAAKRDFSSYQAGTKQRPEIGDPKPTDNRNFISASEFLQKSGTEPDEKSWKGASPYSYPEKEYTETYEANPSVYAYENRGYKSGGGVGSGLSDSETASVSDGGFNPRSPSKYPAGPSGDVYSIPVPFRHAPAPPTAAPAPRPRTIQMNGNPGPNPGPSHFSPESTSSLARKKRNATLV
ncbi:unnamed protein product [Darwinula stevensoni]|uniref:Calcium-activated chloride channel N-terminal domain-containing protein n=1 Tax=Darwinula stevensoni TaxID=69355 RepID=A0A7R8WYZ7_9CRUS|nr:unnamed protein product [Darwinula stevensoni]CAG0879993.1 unnamed protein product [Darwinula stevensoni]